MCLKTESAHTNRITKFVMSHVGPELVSIRDKIQGRVITN